MAFSPVVLENMRRNPSAVVLARCAEFIFSVHDAYGDARCLGMLECVGDGFTPDAEDLFEDKGIKLDGGPFGQHPEGDLIIVSEMCADTLKRLGEGEVA